MIFANKYLCITALIVAGSALVGCVQTPRQQNPWAGISSTSQQQPASGDAYQDSYVDSKVDRQVNRQQSHVNHRINRETDQAVDSAVGNMLDSIFE